MKILRSVLAVLAGLVVLTIASFAIEWAADPLLLRLFPRAVPNASALETNLYASVFMYFYTALCVVAGGYVTAWIARRSPARHAIAMGVVELALTLWAMQAVVVHAPLRNWIMGIVMVIPAAWLGGLLRSRQITKRGTAGAGQGEALA
jgi:drug/metabolite transporter superfamily protein YnfA